MLTKPLVVEQMPEVAQPVVHQHSNQEQLNHKQLRLHLLVKPIKFHKQW